MIAPTKNVALAWSHACLVFAVVVLAWWPIDTYWQSDDFLAITYANDWRRALNDFVGNQYGAPGMVWFYRPLITLSFAVDAAVGGGAPFVSHLSNCLAHGCSAVMVAMLAQRILGRGAGLRAGPQVGLRAGLLWGLWPAHAGSILWAVGRVDSHTVVWILLTLVLLTRWLDRGRGLPVAAWIAAAAALASKELALVTPGLVALLSFGLAASGRRWRSAARATAPFVVLVFAYFAWRWLVLGRVLGGYEGGGGDLASALAGLAQWSGRCVNALQLGHHDWWPLGDSSLASFAFVGFAAPLWATLALVRRRRVGTLLLLVVAYLGCTLPLVQFWPQTSDVKNARYFYLPAAAALAVVAGGGWWPTVLALALAAMPWLEVRTHYLDLHQRAARMHATLRERVAQIPPGPVFVQGLPRENRHGDVVAFHLWIDRLLDPPFGRGRHRLRALRPLAQRPGLLPAPQGAPPLGVTLRFDDTDALVETQSTAGDLEVRVDGPTHLDTRVIWDLHRGRGHADLVMVGDRSAWFRLTTFTGCGSLTAVLRNEADPDAPDGRVGLGSWLQARYATLGDDSHVLFALAAPATFDAEPAFPVWVEAGDCPGNDPGRFVSRRSARQCVSLRFDRDLSELVAGRTPDPATTKR